MNGKILRMNGINDLKKSIQKNIIFVEMKKLSNPWIIHLFALLHFTVALCCRAAGLADDLMLTLLTMVLALMICLNRQTTGLFMASCVIAVNVVGFALGWCTATPLKLVFDSPLVVYPLSTLISTEIIGWSLDGCAKLNRKRHPVFKPESSGSTLRWLLVAFVVIIVIRLLIVVENRGFEDIRSTIVGIIVDYVFSCLALVLVAESAIKASEKAEAAKAEANLAQYRYLKLKQQVNPHFLFNSLNILDCLIQENNPGQASSYVHKLADIYRYMTGNDDKRTVNLEDEMDFVSKYIDLISVRWPEGLEFQIDIPKDQMKRKVIPCSIQMLIENAIKHNAVLPDRKLIISIRATDKSIVVGNNRNPKFNGGSCTGIGLANLRQQYRDLGDKSIIVKSTDEAFTVILPFL